MPIKPASAKDVATPTVRTTDKPVKIDTRGCDGSVDPFNNNNSTVDLYSSPCPQLKLHCGSRTNGRMLRQLLWVPLRFLSIEYDKLCEWSQSVWFAKLFLLNIHDVNIHENRRYDQFAARNEIYKCTQNGKMEKFPNKNWPVLVSVSLVYQYGHTKRALWEGGKSQFDSYPSCLIRRTSMSCRIHLPKNCWWREPRSSAILLQKNICTHTISTAHLGGHTEW